MKIVVCVKQVPEITDVKVNHETGTLRREGVSSILNPFCEYALDHAVRLKRLNPAVEITAISMGPPQARAALLRAMELGADRAILASDLKFAGSDTWATALTLAETIRKAEPNFDLVFFGKQAIDGDTAQVGPEVAEILGLPQIVYGVSAALTGRNRRIQVRREMEYGYQVLEARLPAMVTFSKGEVFRRIPSFMDVMAARLKPYQIITAKDLGIEPEELGLTGSLTQVVKIFPPEAKTGGRKLSGLDAKAASGEILDYLEQNGLLYQ